MLIVDANVLLHAVNQDSAEHIRARGWLDAALAGPETVGFAWTALLAFLRVSTHPAVFSQPLATEDALVVVRSWLAQPTAAIVEPSSRHLAILAGLLAATGTAGNLVNDAHLAALAVEHAGALVSFDTDFARFDGLDWRSPPRG